MPKQKIDSAQLRAELANFTGTQEWHRHSLVRSMLMTDGVMHMAEAAGVFWLLDIIAFEIFRLQKTEPFLSITLDVLDGKGELKVTDGNDRQLYKRHIPFTDCPPGRWGLYLCDKVLLLPSEY
ncbi:DUF6876 family protein [Propionivibrio sp.]|uniref:DUF6876 family protein n=1 Tax=Propionivibrio sp. TaxID=2212460 RepID=UPI003BF0294D